MGQPLGSSGGAYIQFNPATRERASDPFNLNGKEVMSDAKAEFENAQKDFLEGKWRGVLTQKEIDQRSILEKGMKIQDDKFEAFIRRYNSNELISYDIPGEPNGKGRDTEKLHFKMAPSMQNIKAFQKELSSSSKGMIKALRSGDIEAYKKARDERTATVSRFLKQVAIPHRVAMTQTAYNKMGDLYRANKKLLTALKKGRYKDIKKISENASKLGLSAKYINAINRYSEALKLGPKGGLDKKNRASIRKLVNGKVKGMEHLSLKQLELNVKKMQTQLKYTKTKAAENGIQLKVGKNGKAKVEKATQKTLNRLASRVNKELNTKVNPKKIQISPKDVNKRVNAAIKNSGLRNTTKSTIFI